MDMPVFEDVVKEKGRLKTTSRATIFYLDPKLKVYIAFLKYIYPGTSMREILNQTLAERADNDLYWQENKDKFVKLVNGGTI